MPTDDADVQDDADTLPGNEVVTGKAIAIDVSKNTTWRDPDPEPRQRRR